MNYLNRLIKEFCPHGVTYLKLENFLKIKNGGDYKHLGCGTYPVYGSGGIMTYVDSFVYDKPSVLIPRKGSIDKLYYVTEPFWNVDTVFYTDIDVTVAIPKYVYFCLQKSHLEQYNTAGGVPSLTQKVLNCIRIPLPPLAVQQEIVRILDSFTELTTELNKKLTAELTARRKQYEHYRDELMNTAKDLQERSFSELFDFQNGFAFKSSSFKESGSPILRITNIQEQHINTSGLVYFSSEDYRENLAPFIVYPGDIVVAMSGATTGKIGVNDTNLSFYLNQRVGKFIPRENVILKQYLYHLLLKYSGKLLEISSGSGAQPNLSSEKLKRLTAQVPSIPEQTRILNLLERFDVLNTSLGSGLPAEITARQKQYEYYRDKLLTFKELER